MATNREYVIIGCGIAGISAAETLRKADPDCGIRMFTSESWPFYARIRLPEILSGKSAPEKLILHPLKWYEEQRINLYLSEFITKIDPKQHLVISNKEKYPYTSLLLACGSSSFIPPIEGASLLGVFTLRTMEDALNIAEFSKGRNTALVIGGGLLGLEAASSLIKAGLKVTVLEVFPRLLPRQTDEKAASLLQRQLEAAGFKFMLDVKVSKIFGENRVEGIILENGEVINGDMVLISAGVRSNIDLAKSAGIKVNKGILVDDNLRTSIPDIFAAGDAAEHKGISYGIWSAAQEQGAIAGGNMAGGDKKYTGTIPSNRLKVVGIDMVAAGELDPDGKFESDIQESDKYYRKLVYDGNKNLLGCILLGNIEKYNEIIKSIKR